MKSLQIVTFAYFAADDHERQPQYGAELTADQWQPWDFDPLDLSPQHLAVRLPVHKRLCAYLLQVLHSTSMLQPRSGTFPCLQADSGIRSRSQSQTGADQKFNFGEFIKGDLPKKLAIMLVSRLDLYKPTQSHAHHDVQVCQKVQHGQCLIDSCIPLK